MPARRALMTTACCGFLLANAHGVRSTPNPLAPSPIKIHAQKTMKNLAIGRVMRDLAKFFTPAVMFGLLLGALPVSAGTFSFDLTTNISQSQYYAYTSGALESQGAFLSEEWSSETVLFDGETLLPGTATLTFTVNNGDGLYVNTGFNNAGPTLSSFGTALFLYEALGLITGNQSLNDADFTGLNVFVDAIPDGAVEEENSPNYQGGVTVDFSLTLPEGFGSGTEPLLFDKAPPQRTPETTHKNVCRPTAYLSCESLLPRRLKSACCLSALSCAS